MGDQEPLPPYYLKYIPNLQLPPPENFEGHVILVQGIVLPTYVGCRAEVVLETGLRPPRTISVITSEQRFQSLLETALATGNFIQFKAIQVFHGPWAEDPAEREDDLYRLSIGIIVHNNPVI
jgi:hypothetical protein